MKYLNQFVFPAVLLLLATAAQALEKQPYSDKLFKQLQSRGEVILIDVYASWCPTCAKQQTAITAYRQANPDKKFHVLVVDFDKDKKFVRQFRAPRQSTLILYRGNEQFWFSVAESRPQVIAAELDKAINFKAKS